MILFWAVLSHYPPTGHVLLKDNTLSSFVTLLPYWACIIKGTTLSSFVTLLSYWACFSKGYYFELFCYSIILLGMLY